MSRSIGSNCEATFTITTCINRRIHSATTASLPILTASNYNEQIQRGIQGSGVFLGSDGCILVSDYEATAPVSVSMHTLHGNTEVYCNLDLATLPNTFSTPFQHSMSIPRI